MKDAFLRELADSFKINQNKRTNKKPQQKTSGVWRLCSSLLMACPRCNCGLHYPRRLIVFVAMTAITLIIFISLMLGVTGPAIHQAENNWRNSTCTFSCDDCLKVYFTVNPQDFSPHQTSPPRDAFGVLDFALQTDKPYEQGQEVACWYNPDNITTRTFSTEQLLNNSADIPIDYPPPLACAPVGFELVCNHTKQGVATCAVAGMPNSTVICKKNQDETTCFRQLAAFFPADSSWICGLSEAGAVTLQRDFSGFWLIIEGFLLTFSLFGISGIILSTLISPDPRNNVRCFGLFDL